MVETLQSMAVFPAFSINQRASPWGFDTESIAHIGIIGACQVFTLGIGELLWRRFSRFRV